MAKARLVAEDYILGTLVLKTGTSKGYGVVVDPKHWLAEARKEDSEKAGVFEAFCEEAGTDSMIPIMWFGHVIGSRVKTVDGDPHEEFYVERYTWSNVGGDITIIPRFDRLQQTFHQMLLFFGGSNARYIEQCQQDLRCLKMYLEGGYDLESTGLSAYSREMIMLFEKAIPRENYFACRNPDPEKMEI
jgi:hypothetical protein